MSTSTLSAQDSRSFDAGINGIRIRRRKPFGGAKYLVFNAANPAEVFGAGESPALSAHPPYHQIDTRGLAFVVQSVDGDLEVETL